MQSESNFNANKHNTVDEPCANTTGTTWLIQPIAKQPERFEVLQFSMQDHKPLMRWHSTWEQFEGSYEALNSFALPNTQVLLNIEHDNYLDAQWQAHDFIPDSHWWCALRDSPLGIHAKPISNQEYSIVRALAHHGVTVQGVHYQKPEDALRNVVFNVVQLSELRAIHQWSRACQSNQPTAIDWVKLHINLWWNARHGWKSRKALLLTLLFSLGLILCTFTFLPGFHTQHTEMNASEVSRQTSINNSNTSTTLGNAQPKVTDNILGNTEIIWNDWLVQLSKLGKEERANIRGLHFVWTQGHGAHGMPAHIKTQILLDRPRKRLPKGCEGIAVSPSMDHAYSMMACSVPWNVTKHATSSAMTSSKTKARANQAEEP